MYSCMLYVESMYNLGLMYSQGRGAPRDFSQAIAYFEAAALLDHAPAVYMINELINELID